MSIDLILNKLDKVRCTGHGRWLACCPAHDDKSPSLSLKLLDDGRILIHCFSGCDVSSIVSAIDLKMEDLFPPREVSEKGERRERIPFPANDILKALLHEITIVSMAAYDISLGHPVSIIDYARIELARTRIDTAIDYAKN